MTYLNLFLVFLMALTASCCQGQSIEVISSLASSFEFEGSRFRRVCYIDSVPAMVTAIHFRWLKNGAVFLEQNSSATYLDLDIEMVALTDTGRYVCEATLFSAAGAILPALTTSEEAFTVLSVAPLDAPAVQVGRNGSDFTLQCSYIGADILWLDRNTFHPLTLADEGNYTCAISVIIGDIHRILNREILLLVDAPVKIVSHSEPVNQSLTQNRPVSLSISFTGSVSGNLMVTWYHNGMPIPTPDPRISTTLSHDAVSQSSLTFLPAQRADKGTYRVEVITVVGDNPPSREEQTFQLNVTVLPSHPSGLSIALSSSTTARASWDLTNTTADSGSHTLHLHLTYTHNRSLASTRTLPGTTTTHLLEELAPATNYTLQVTAINPDGMASSHIQSFATREGSALLNSVTASHINATHVAITIDVAYTGGGNIHIIRVTNNPGVVVNLQGVERLDALRYRALFVRQEETENEPLVLAVAVLNQHNYVSNSKQVELLPYEATSQPPTATTDADTSNSSAVVSQPVWFIPVIAAAAAVVIIFLVCSVAVCLGVCYRCRHKKGNLPVSALNRNVGIKQIENGRGENVYSPSHSQSSMEEFRSRSQTGSVASSTCGGRTPSLDKIHHKRVPSDCSSNISINKPNFATPSTTASSSPSTLIKGGGPYTSQDQGLGMIMEMDPVSHTSDDSCPESDRDRLRVDKSLDEMDKHNHINAELHRAPGDGSPCDSHLSLANPSGSNLMISVSNPLLGCDPKVTHSDSRLFTGVSRISSPAHEYMYSDCESVASTEVSCGNCSLPSHQYPTHHAHHVHHPSRHLHQLHNPRYPYKHTPNASLKSVYERTDTPYNREYDTAEGSMV